MTEPFVHLHCHSEYSLLDGLSRIPDLVGRAAELGQPAIALTDHGAMYGVIEFYRAAKGAGVKPIIGMESYMARHRMEDRHPELDKERYHLLLLAMNQTGYKNLLKLASEAQLRGYYYRPRVDKETLAKYSEGLIVTTGCLAAEVPRFLEREQPEEAARRLEWYLEVFGRERFFVELQSHNIPQLHRVNRTLLEWARKYDLKLVATNDVHYVRRDDAVPHDVLLCVQTGKTIDTQGRMRMSDDSYYLKSYQEMLALFGEVPEALRNTVLVAEMCEVSLESDGYHLPHFDVPEGHTPQTYLRELAERGLRARYGDRAETAEVRQRFEYELKVIHEMGFDTYFLIVWDLCRYARENGIWWNVRGSGAGSIVAYCLGITNLDPLKYNLIFERFLNPGRVSMPDIDMDFPDDQRAQMMAYAVEKYGAENVAQIITFGTMGARAAIRDVGRAMGLPNSQVDRIAKLVPFGPKVKLKDAFENPEFAQLYEKDPQVRELVDTAMKLEGIARHASTHAAGVIISDKPLVEYCPLHRPTKGDQQDEAGLGVVTQWPMEILESIGLLKVDFLGLATLTIMRKACELIEQRHGVRYDLNTIPYERCPDDPEKDAQVKKLYDLLASGETTGIFQVESAGMREVLRGMRPTQFEHIIAAISLYRPGPMEYIPNYIRRMHGEEEIEYHHPRLKPILEETYGICVSGDTLVINTRTGERCRLADLGDHETFFIQGIDEEWQTRVAPVTHWIASGEKMVYRVVLRNGASIKITADHRVLTEEGWKPLEAIRVGDYIATPPFLVEPEEPLSCDRRRLRVLAYLLGDGSLASGAAVDFVSKDAALQAEYVRCLAAFENVKPHYTEQIREVLRIGASKGSDPAHYHHPNALLTWLRELGLKAPPGTRPGGCRSHEKFVPAFVFRLPNEDVAFFLASLWECDGYLGAKLAHYRTVSRQLAEDIQTLLLRLGIQATIYEASYETESGKTRIAYQVTVYDTVRLAALLQPHMVSSKRHVECHGQADTTLDRELFIQEVDARLHMSRRQLMREYGIDRQHFLPSRRASAPRISARVVAPVADAVPLPETKRRLNVVWQEVVAIEPVGIEPVYDLTVPGLHSFVGNNIIVHNCVYQEQIIQIASELAGYSPGDADLMRRAVAKKKEKEIERHRQIFVEGCVKNGIPEETARAIYADIEFFARYGFNKCLPGDVEVIDGATGRLVKIRDLVEGRATLTSTLACDTTRLKLRTANIEGVYANGIQPVYRLTTRSGRQIEATANHPFYTYEGWRLLAELRPGDCIATPRRIPIEGKNVWPQHRLIVLGYLLAEGNLCHPHSVYFYSQDREQVDDYIRAAEQFDNVKCTVATHRGTWSVYARRIRRNQEPELVTWLKELGLWGCNAHSKHIPDDVFALRNDQIALLLARMWEGDGHINVKGRSLFYATASERMARQMQHLLLRFGIVSRLRTVKFPYKDGRMGYQLFITGQENFQRFTQHIGVHFLSSSRQEALEALIQEETKSPMVLDVVPLPVKELVRAAKEQNNVTWADVREATGIAPREFYPTNNPTKRGFARRTIQRLAEYFDDPELQRLAESDIYWDIVERIEYVGEKETFDLSVLELHNFIANDIVVHNSHAADYAVITCQTAFLKAHYPVEYMTALLTVERHNSDKVALYVAEARRLGIAVLPPDINKSDVTFTIEPNPNPPMPDLPPKDPRRWAIRFGLGAIKNVGEGTVQQILAERKANGPFRDIDDFCRRVDLRQLNRRTLEYLIKAGCFDELVRPVVPDAPRETLLVLVDRMMNLSAQVHAAAEVGQMSMFDFLAQSGQPSESVKQTVLHPLPQIPPADPKKRLADEKESLGLYISSHPLQEVAAEVGKRITAFCGEITVDDAGQVVVVAGLVKEVRTITTRKGDLMAFVLLEDLQGEIEVVVFPRIYAECREHLTPDAIVLVRGRVEVRNDTPSILADAVEPYRAGNDLAEKQPHEAAEAPKEQLQPPAQYLVHITFHRTDDERRDTYRFQRMMELLQAAQGEDRVRLTMVLSDGREVVLNFPRLTTRYSRHLKTVLESAECGCLVAAHPIVTTTERPRRGTRFSAAI